jgi:hypothetical protein
LKNIEKEPRQPFEFRFGFCFQQNVYGGWGRWLKDAGRGLARESAPIAVIAVIANIARDRKSKILPRIIADNSGSGNDPPPGAAVPHEYRVRRRGLARGSAPIAVIAEIEKAKLTKETRRTRLSP